MHFPSLQSRPDKPSFVQLLPPQLSARGRLGPMSSVAALFELKALSSPRFPLPSLLFTQPSPLINYSPLTEKPAPACRWGCFAVDPLPTTHNPSTRVSLSLLRLTALQETAPEANWSDEPRLNFLKWTAATFSQEAPWIFLLSSTYSRSLTMLLTQTPPTMIQPLSMWN